MTARERANALAFYVKEETSEWTGHMIPRFMQEIEAAEREAYNKAIEDAAQVADDLQYEALTASDFVVAIRKLKKA